MGKIVFQRHHKQFLAFVILLLILPVLVAGVQLTIRYFSKASGAPANIVIDYNSVSGPFPQSYKALAQGGEEKQKLLSATINQVRALNPSYIRIDHLFDMYDILQTNGRYDFTKLDVVVDDILKTGALPFLSLSYMPTQISQGDVTDKPKDWAKWKDLVRVTVEHYSGRRQKNLANVYYEVWNEPDLFGNWKTYGEKNYLDLYRETVNGALSAQNVNEFNIGGPGTTGFYPEWMNRLLDFTISNNIKIDFVSYHRYDTDVSVFSKDLNDLTLILNRYPKTSSLPIIITEWGSEAKNDSRHDNNFDAIHALAVMRQLLDKVSLAFTFEIKDGPGEKEYWGRWGILTHDKFGLHPKPKYHALKLLNKLAGERLNVIGEGTFVTAMASRNNQNINIVLVNYDASGKNTENVPVRFINLPKANYVLKASYLFGRTNEEYLTSENGEISREFLMPPLSAVNLELTMLSPVISYSLGYFGYSGNFGLRLGPADEPFVLKKSDFSLPGEGTMEFFLKNTWDENNPELVIYNVALNANQELSLKRKLSGFNYKLEYGISENGQPKNVVNLPISWNLGSWHHLVMSWGSRGLSLSVDGNSQNSNMPFSFNLAGDLTIKNFGGVIDELRILKIRQPETVLPIDPYVKDNNTLILKHFDRSIN